MNIISLEGCDGSSKSTQAVLLRDWLAHDCKKSVEHIVMPGATKLGQEIRRLVKSKDYTPSPVAERLLFAADMAQTVREKIDVGGDGAGSIRPDFLVTDRWQISDFIYGPAVGVDPDWIGAIHEAAGIVRQCDLLLLFNCPVEVILERKQAMAHERGQECRIEAQGEAFLRRVAEGYRDLCQQIERNDPGKSGLPKILQDRAKQVVVIDAAQSRDDIKHQIQEAVKPLL